MLGYRHKLIQHTQLHFPQAKVTIMIVSSLHLSATLSTYQYILVCTGDVQVHTYAVHTHTSFQSGKIAFATLTSLLLTLVLCFAGSNLPLCSLLDCQATQARLATSKDSKLPQPLVNGQPRRRCCHTCHALQQRLHNPQGNTNSCSCCTWTSGTCVLASRHALQSPVKQGSVQYNQVCTDTNLVHTGTYLLHAGTYWYVLLHTRQGHIAQGICIPCTYMYRLGMHQYTQFILGGERLHVSSHTLHTLGHRCSMNRYKPSTYSCDLSMY
jgi:hypothetical protein